jgi:hypothetical protein
VEEAAYLDLFRRRTMSKQTRYELTLTHEGLGALVTLLKHEIPERFWTGPCPEHFQPLIALACTIAEMKTRATIGGYWCQNCSLTLLETQGGICRECQKLLKENHAKHTVVGGGPHGPVIVGPDAT